MVVDESRRVWGVEAVFSVVSCSVSCFLWILRFGSECFWCCPRELEEPGRLSEVSVGMLVTVPRQTSKSSAAVNGKNDQVIIFKSRCSETFPQKIG